jgi:hypothetical protein
LVARVGSKRQCGGLGNRHDSARSRAGSAIERV